MLGSWFGGRNNPAPAASTPQREPSTQQRVKILMVDDNAANLLSLESVLESLGEELVRAQSGREALKRCLEDDFAVILLDVKMPDMDGFETAQLIRARDRSRHTPILFLTGYRNEEQLYRGYYMGAVDFLFKPIVPEILRSKVAVFVELSRNSELLRRQTEAVQQKNAELEQAFAAHRKTEQRFRSLLEAAPDAMVISDSAGRIDLVNSQTEKLLGYAREELLGRDIRMLVPEWQYREGPQSAQETVGLHKEGGRVSVEISSSPLQTEQGLLVTSALRDMTERKRNEERIHHLNASLEQRVQERTAELLRSNDELKQFAYVASHDLQEPLRMVASYVQLLGKRYKGKLDPDADEFIEYVVQGVRRMHDLINDLLAFSRIDTRETSFRDVDMDSVMHEVRMNLQIMIQENQATVTNDVLPELTADSVQMVQLLQNLVGNAMKYRRPEAPPCVHVSAEEVDGEDGSLEWLFRVQDNGIGIEPQYTEIVFGIFKRLHSRDRYPGTGIGLAICKRIVERHGGRIWVESTPGQGSLFQFTIPV